MASVLLSVAGGAIGGMFGPVGMMIGRAVGALAGAAIDNAVIRSLAPTTRQTGPRLTTTDITNSTEGSVIARQYGRGRMAGQIFWSTRFEEVITRETQGGKGSQPRVETTTYAYYANFAIGLCEGPIAGIGRIWFDGSEIDQEDFRFRVYRGTATQPVDSLISAKEGGNAPAYRDLAYVVFERLALEDFGNRIPQVHVEVFRSVGTFEASLQGVALLPGNEFLYEPRLVRTGRTRGEKVAENRHTLTAPSDWHAALDRLQMLAPDLRQAMLVVPWFGDDLRCATCTIRPKVVSAGRDTTMAWQVAGVSRGSAGIVSVFEGSAAYGGTPNDASVIRAIRDLKARGIRVTLLPFIMMDIPAANGRPDPYGAVEQAAHPWRGRIACHPAPGRPSTPDKTSTAASQVATFLGSATVAQFGASGDSVTFSGGGDWHYRRFILHYAKLAAIAGGVDSFLIGSEMIGLTTVRSSATTYPFVTALKSLAADCRAMLGTGTKISYAADWSEYHSHRPADGSGDLIFHLDPLWSDDNIDFVGIDNYMPLADWRDGTAHRDFQDGLAASIYEDAYLRGQVEGGEHYDFTYPDLGARGAQARSAISDPTDADEAWAFRLKDFRGWWGASHHNRPVGLRSASATGWTPQSKPIVFTEMGCPACDKGANQPNVFVDAKSSESAWPHFSNRARDDGMQRAYLEALTGYWRDNAPVSTVYGGPMIDLARSHVWCFDVRPWPSFPEDAEAWGDAPNWDRGHWINGRLGTAPAADTIRAILADYGFPLGDAEIEAIASSVDGVTMDRVGSARSLLDSIAPVHAFDAVESEGKLKFRGRLGRRPVAAIEHDDLALPEGEEPIWSETHGQETELPDAVKLTFGDPARDDQPGSAEARRAGGSSRRVTALDLPVIMAETRGRAAAEALLHEAWIGRGRAEFQLPPSHAALEPGDIVTFGPSGGRQFRITVVSDGTARKVSAEAADPAHYAPAEMPRSDGARRGQPQMIDPMAVWIDGPQLASAHADHVGYLAALAAPFKSGIAFYRAPGSTGFQLDTIATAPAMIGESLSDFWSGPVWRFDRVNELYIALYRGQVASAEEALVFNGANAFLIENEAGEWEICQFTTARLHAPRVYALSGLLRGQLGSEHAMRRPVAAGARIVILDAAVLQPNLPVAQTGLTLNWRFGPADRAYSDPAYQATSFTFTGRGRRPLSPVQIRGLRDPATGDWRLRWLRRTRIDGDNFDAVDVPLGEETESYRIDILDGAGGSVKRTATVSTGAYLYTAADQVSDFGSVQWELFPRIAQISATFGAGIASEAHIWNRETPA